MKTEMKIVVVGAKGVVGSALVEFLKWLDHQVFCVDIDNVKDLPQIAKEAEVAFIAVPISKIAEIARELVVSMKPGSLIVSGGSVAQPAEPNAIDFALIREKGIAFALIHFMFRPEKPLKATLFGQNIALAIEGEETGKWRSWIEEQFISFGPFFHQVDGAKHDRVTTISQLFHMITAALAARLWNATDEAELTLGVKTGGFPCQSIIRSALRSMQAPKLIIEILTNHPQVLTTLATLRLALTEIEQAVRSGVTAGIEKSLTKARGRIEIDLLKETDWTAGELIRLEADLRKPKLIFDFPALMNGPGLLARVMGEFDRLGINKTSTFAHNLPNGGCRFIVGVESINDQVRECEEKIRSFIP